MPDGTKTEVAIGSFAGVISLGFAGWMIHLQNELSGLDTKVDAAIQRIDVAKNDAIEEFSNSIPALQERIVKSLSEDGYGILGEFTNEDSREFSPDQNFKSVGMATVELSADSTVRVEFVNAGGDGESYIATIGEAEVYIRVVRKHPGRNEVGVVIGEYRLQSPEIGGDEILCIPVSSLTFLDDKVPEGKHEYHLEVKSIAQKFQIRNFRMILTTLR